MTTAALALERCAALARLSSEPDRLTRVHLSPEHAAANRLAAGWLEAAGATTWVDAVGNLWGRREGREPGLPALVLGSHLDTVPDAGAFDGPLGVVAAVAVLERLGARTADLPFALEVVGFTDEEGARFGKALLGSQPVAGTWDDAWLGLRDRDGVSLREALDAFGLDAGRVHEAARRPGELVGYLEAHIEQGPHLEAAGVALGHVTTIAGARRFRIAVLGEARHAGGTPYERRRDALAGAAEIVLAAERVARADGSIATVGRLDVTPGADNVIPGRVDLSLDLRAASDAERDATGETLLAELRASCAARGLRLEVTETHRAPSATCASRLTDAVVAGVRATGQAGSPGLWSRAGHDAMAMAAVTDVAMLFVRCRDGISHHPDESVREDDVARALDALEHAVLVLAEEAREPGRSQEPGSPEEVRTR